MKRFFFLIALLTTIVCNAQTYNFEQGVKAYDENNYEKALPYFDHEINDNPKNALALFYRAVIYYVQDKKSFALRDINNSITNFSSKDKKMLAGAHRLRGEIYSDLKIYDKTFEDYSIAIRLAPTDPKFCIGRAQIYFDLKQYSKAELDYKQALKIDESYVKAYAGLGKNYIYQKNYSDAEKVLNICIKLDPEYSEGYRFRARAYYEQKKYDEAIEDIFKALLLDEKDELYGNLFLEYAGKNYSLSLSKVNAQIFNQPENSTWYFIRTKLYEAKNYYKEAINDYTKLMTLFDSDAKSALLEDRGSCYLYAGMYEESIKDFSEAISIDSTDAYNYGFRGDAKRLMGNFIGAKEDLTKAIRIKPSEAWFYYRRGWIEDEFLKDNEAGLNDYTDAISINKKFSYAYLMRGRLYESKLNNPAKAKEDFNNILSIETVIDDQGNCRQYALFHLGRHDEAIAWMNKILEQFPTGGNYYDATCLYSLMNKPNDAIAMLKLALKNGYRDFNHLATDDDIDVIRNMPEFKNLVAEWKNIFDESLKKDLAVKKDEIEIRYQTVSIPMKSQGGGTYEVGCKINELGLNLIFDTGASDISISQTEVDFMLKNGYLDKNDITGSQAYQDANGDVEIGTTIILKKVNFGGLILKNVKASVVHNKKAPLLFGQSALSKYGKITIDNENKTITITTRVEN